MVKDKESLDFLYSYWFEINDFRKGRTSKVIQAIRKYKPKESKFYLDSGVFSARRKNIILPVDELIKFYKQNDDIIDYVFNMDNGSNQEQLDNYIKMHKAGVPVIGIWHGDCIVSDMPLEYIDRFLEYSDYISIGVKAGDKKQNQAYCGKLFDYLHKRNLWPTKVHILGSESFNLLSKYPFYSSDSSTIVQTYKLGQITYFDKKRLKLDMIHPKNEPMKVLREFHDLEKYIEEFHLKKGGRNQDARNERIKQTIQQRFNFQTLITDLWNQRNIKW